MGVLGGAVQKSGVRNGTESRELLPLWWGNFWDWEPLPFGVCRSVSLYRSLDLESLPLLLSLPSLVLEPS